MRIIESDLSTIFAWESLAVSFTSPWRCCRCGGFVDPLPVIDSLSAFAPCTWRIRVEYPIKMGVFAPSAV